MRIIALLCGLAIAAAAAAQDKSKPAAPDTSKPAAQDTSKPAAPDAAKPPAAVPQELDKDTLTRIRAERFAGGLGNITPEEKAAANVGAGPHRHSEPGGEGAAAGASR